MNANFASTLYLCSYTYSFLELFDRSMGQLPPLDVSRSSTRSRSAEAIVTPLTASRQMAVTDAQSLAL